MTDGVLSGLRVVDFSSGPAGGLATTVLADFGADVIKVEPPAGDRFRSTPSSPFWLRGKRSVVLDLTTESDRGQARELVASADVVVAGGPPSRLRSFGIDQSLCDQFPGLVHCTISGWGVNGPYAELPGYEGLVAAKSGRMAAFDVQLDQGRPVYSAVQVATHGASQAAVQGIVAALLQREQTGRGAAVETSLVQALMPFDLVDLLARQIAVRDGRSFTPLRQLSPMPTLNYHPLRTSDGKWIQCGNLLEHLFYSFLDAIDLLGEFLIDEKFQGSPAVWSVEATEEARDRILIRMQERTADEWMQAFAENGNVAAEPIISAAEALSHIDLVEGQGLVEIDDASVGAVTQIAPIAELVATPASVLGGSPTIGQHTHEVLDALVPRVAVEPAEAPGAGVAGAPGRPLEGITVVDLSTIIAAPLAMAMLADLGARVIKVEPYGGDPFRAMNIEGRMAVKTNVGKESICINLKTAEGQAILHELAVDADVLIHNFRGEVPDKLGIGYEQLRAINPDLIWAVVNGYGPHGPGAKRPATHPVMGASTGGVALQAGEALTRDCPTLADVRENSRQIMAANEANPDPNTSVVAASAVMLALFARERRGGGGQMVRINMQVANAWANHDDFLAYEGKPERQSVDSDHHGLHARYRLYPTADGWVFLAATTDAEFARFCASAGCERLATHSMDDDPLAAELTAVFAGQSAEAWEAQLVAAGVGCVRADSIEVDRFIGEDPHMVGNGWAPLVDHTRFGRLRRWGPVVTVGGLNPDYRAAPLAGEHTDAILASLGHDAASIASLRETKVVNSEPV
ncbi:CoA transferase [Acidimicrobiales bacterium]|nr:CoA transferase [Acidimicrobiales bacterium]